MVEDLLDDRRAEPPFGADERAMLEGWLEFHRVTLLLKCEGLTADQLKARPIPTSLLSLHGLMRHAAEVERNWFTRCLLRAPETPALFTSDGDEEEPDLFPLDEADWDADRVAWEKECGQSRVNAGLFDLDHAGLRHGEECSLRWIYTHMIEEYARHNGHADLIRELIDGSVGY